MGHHFLTISHDLVDHFLISHETLFLLLIWRYQHGYRNHVSVALQIYRYIENLKSNPFQVVKLTGVLWNIRKPKHAAG